MKTGNEVIDIFTSEDKENISLVSYPAQQLCLYYNIFSSPSTGELRVWSLPDGQCVHSRPVSIKQDASAPMEIVHATLCEKMGKIVIVTFDHNIILYEMETLMRHKQVLWNMLSTVLAATGGDYPLPSVLDFVTAEEVLVTRAVWYQICRSHYPFHS